MNRSISISNLGLLMMAAVLPVSSVALHSLEWIHIRFMIIPNIVMISICCYLLINSESTRKFITNGWIGGLVAVLIYDLSRIPFIYAGWDDFIPGLGGAIAGGEENFTIGYLWRYLGNGAGLGLGFAALSHFFKFRKVVLAGLIYGVCVFLCLDIVLVSSDVAQANMFKITPLSFTGSLIGHVVYGTVLGFMMKRLSK